MNQYSKGAWTPLHLAVKSGSTDLMELLMKSNADVNVKTSDGFTPASDGGVPPTDRRRQETVGVRGECMFLNEITNLGT